MTVSSYLPCVGSELVDVRKLCLNQFAPNESLYRFVSFYMGHLVRAFLSLADFQGIDFLSNKIEDFILIIFEP